MVVERPFASGVELSFSLLQLIAHLLTVGCWKSTQQDSNLRVELL